MSIFDLEYQWRSIIYWPQEFANQNITLIAPDIIDLHDGLNIDPDALIFWREGKLKNTDKTSYTGTEWATDDKEYYYTEFEWSVITLEYEFQHLSGWNAEHFSNTVESLNPPEEISFNELLKRLEVNWLMDRGLNFVEIFLMKKSVWEYLRDIEIYSLEE